jgi:hypothetical protein
MKRGRILPWRPHEDDYLRQHYATMSADAIAFFLRRAKGGVWQRAVRLGLSKPHGGNFQPGHTPANKGQRTKLRIWERIVALFEHHSELTQSDMASILDIPIGSISNSLGHRTEGLMHIDRWQLVDRHYIAIYVAGPGEDAEKPNQRLAKEFARESVLQRITEPDPIPRPIFGLWGMPVSTDYRKAAEAA